MDWANERYVRLYIRDTKTWILLGWEGQATFSLMIRKVDRAGVLDDIFDGADLAVIFSNGIPVDVVDRGLSRLVELGVVERTDIGLVIPNFIEAQEAAMSDKQRQRESRARRRDRSRSIPVSPQRAHDMVRTALLNGEIKRKPCEICGSNLHVVAHHEDYSKPLDVTWICASCHKTRHNVTQCDNLSHETTASHAVPYCADHTKSNNNETTSLSMSRTPKTPSVDIGVAPPSGDQEDLFPSQPTVSMIEGSKKVPKGRATWSSYSSAYTKRYGVEPKRNKMESTHCCQIVNKIGADEAPLVAAYYVTVNTNPYLHAGHPLNLLVRDVQKIRTQWLSGRQITSHQSSEADRLQGAGEMWTRIGKETE